MFRAGVALVRVDAQVVEGRRIVSGLSKEDFEVTDEGTPQPVTWFGRESEPVWLLLVLDVSGSMRRYLEQMASVARGALGQLRAEDQAGVMLFSRRTRLSRPFTGELGAVAAELSQAVRERSLGSGTLINASLIEAARAIQGQGSGRRAILIVTDNGGLNYQTPDEQVLRALYQADAVLNAIVVAGGKRPEPPRKGQDLNPDFTPSDVFRLAEESGGEAVAADRADTAFREIVERLRTRYSLHYRAPAGTPGQFRRIQVELTPAARRRLPKAQVRARAGYYLNPESAPAR